MMAICGRLETCPFELLDAGDKCKLLAFMCDELVASKCCVDEIDATIDSLSELKHERWEIEGKIRDLKTKNTIESLRKPCESDSAVLKESDSAMLKESDSAVIKESDEAIVAEVDNSAADANNSGCSLSGNGSKQMEKKIANLGKKHAAVNKSVDEAYSKLRCGTFLGQDRYYRNYWVLSKCGGVFLEPSQNIKQIVEPLTKNSQIKAENMEIGTENGEIKVGSGFEPLDLSCKKAEEIPNTFKIAEIDELDDVILSEAPASFSTTPTCFINQQLSVYLNTNSKQLNKISYDEMETRIIKSIECEKPAPIDAHVFMNDTWWALGDRNLLAQLDNALAKRGIRERYLAKNLATHRDLLSDETIYEKMSKFVSLSTASGTDSSDQQTCDEASQPKLTRKLSSRKMGEDNEPVNIDNLKQKLTLKIVQEVYALEDRVFTAKLQNKANKSLDESVSSERSSSEEPFEMAKKRLLELEASIERRYLKSPFARKQEVLIDEEDSEASDDENDDSDESEVTPQLVSWREAVSECTSVSQLALCVSQLNRSIAWDKSIMRVICQICNRDDNEDKLLLCDSCDRGNHTYCFKPPMRKIPQGNWYCFVCISKSKGEKLCFVCGGGCGEQTPIHKCHKCMKMFHAQCVPMAKAMKNFTKWLCVSCVTAPKRAVKNSKTDASDVKMCVDGTMVHGMDVDQSAALKRSPGVCNGSGGKRLKTTKSVVERVDMEMKDDKIVEDEMKPKRGKKAKSVVGESNCKVIGKGRKGSQLKNAVANSLKSKYTKTVAHKSKLVVKETTKEAASGRRQMSTEKELAMCRNLLNELGRHDSAWPFQEPVDEKLYPDYYDLIKNPMDVQTIKNKIKNKEYKNKEEFSYDCRLIFDNCEFFNEDDSSIGESGHKLRAFFETKWIEMFN